MISLNTALPATGAEPPKNGVRPQDGQSKGSSQGDLQALFADLVAGLEAAVAGQQTANRPPTAPLEPLPKEPQAPVEAVLTGAAPDQAAEVLVEEALTQEALAQEALVQGLVAQEAVPQAPTLPSMPAVASLPLPPTQTPALPHEAGREAALRAKKSTAAPSNASLMQLTPNSPRPEPNQRVELPRLRSAEGIELAVQASTAVVDKKSGEALLMAVQRPVPSSAAVVAATGSPGAEFRLDGLPSGAKPIQAEWAPMKVDTQQSQWGRDLAAALGDRLSMQVNQNVKEATVRLDPPEMGRIELVVRMDGDRLSVQLNASHAGVRDMLTQHAERLRLDLLAQNLQTVDVQVGQQGQRGNSDRTPLMQQTIAANAVALEAEEQAPPETINDRWLSTSA